MKAVEAHCRLIERDSDGKETVAGPAGAEGGACIEPRGSFSEGVIYITLQEAFWIVSIAWILF